MSSTTRERIVDQAMRLFSENGYSGTSIAKIEAAAGLTPGAGGIYHHFKSKEALLAAGIERQPARGHQSRTDADRPLHPRRARQRVGDAPHPRLRSPQPPAAPDHRRRAARQLHVHGLRRMDRGAPRGAAPPRASN